MHRPVARQVPSAASADRSALSRGQKALLRLQQSKQHTSAAAGQAINTPQATQLSSTHRKPVQQQAVHQQQQQQQQQRQQHVSSRYTTQVLTGSCESVQGYCQQQQQSQLYASQPRLLTAAIKRCRCWQQIQQLLELAAAAVNHIHIVAAIVHSAQVNDRHAQQQHQQQQQQQRAIKQDYGSGKHQQQYQSTKQQQQQQQLPAASAAYESWLLHQTQHLLKQHNSELELRHTSNLLWALAKSRSHAAAETHSSSSSSSSSSGSSGGYANVVHRLLRLQEQQLVGISSHGVQQQQQQQRCLEDEPVPGFSNPPSHQPLKPQDLSNSIWALATMQHQPPESWLQLFWTLSQQCLSNCTMQELSNTIWAVAKLRLLPEQQWIMAFDDAVMAALQQQQHQCTEINNSGTSSGNRSAVSQAYANIAYALGSLYKQQQQQQQQLWQVQSDWVVRYCQATQPLLQDCTAGQLSMMLWGLTAWDSSSSSSASDNAEQQQQQQQQQGLLLSGLWLKKFAAAMQQQLHAFTDQGLVNIAASSYKLLLLSQQQQQQHELQDGVHDRVDSEQQQQHHHQQQHQLRELLRLALQAAPSRLQTMQPTAAAALVWASAGLSSSSSSSGSSSIRFDQSSSSSAAAADAGLPPSCASFMKQYIELHTAAAAAGSSSTDTVQLLWLCAKARQLPSSVAWCQNMSHKLQQQQQLSTGQVAQVMWSLGQLLLLCCQQQQQQQQQRQQVASSVQDNSNSSSSDSNSSSTGAIVSMLQELSLSVIEDGIKILDDMDPLQLVEFAAAAAHITAALPHLMSKQQQQQQAAAAAVPALMTAATTLLHQQQQCREHKLQQQHMLTLLESLHTLLHHVYTAAASSSSSSSTMHKVLDKFLAAAATQIAGSSTYLTVRLALLLLSIAQIPARQAAAAASNRSMQTPIPTAAAAAAGRCNAVTDESSSGLTVSGCTCSPWIQQALCDVLSAEWVQLSPDQLLSAAWLCYRNLTQLSADALSDLLYTLRSNISTRTTTSSSSSSGSSYTPQQQLLLLLLLSRQWRRVPAAAERAKTALIERLLRSSQRYMYAEAIEQQQQQQRRNIQTTAAGGSSSSSSDDEFDGKYLSQLLYGLAQAQISPPEPWLLLYQQLLLLHIPAMTLLQITKVLLGLAKLGFRPQAAVAASLLNRSQQLLPTADRSFLVCIIHALGRLHLIPSDDWLQQFYARALDAPGYFKVSGFGMVVWGLAKVGARPGQEWMQQLVDSTFTEQQQQQVHPVTEGSLVRSKLKPQHLANMVCGFAKLGFVPDAGWMSWFRAQVGQQSGALQELDHFHIEWAWRELIEQQMRE